MNTEGTFRFRRRNPNGGPQRTSDVLNVATTSNQSAEGPTVDAAAALVQRVAQGDEASFAALYDHLAAMVYGVVLRVLRDPAQSEEVAQEVFLELWRSATRFDRSKASVRTWASTVAHRRAVDRVRSEQASRERDDREAAHVATPADTVGAEVESSIDQLRVRKALAALTESQRQAVELAYFGGNTYREVAALLGVPEGTVKTRIRDGMIKLRDELGGGE
ncbi:MAG: sigma-70 family RNA polymerase sigma factor [Actinobacteria bacterium]|uniref:Unannotated protein n=1 Tax=freshwater metagenome TaxID=449393 RepID=A0A6J6SJS0_9ZZZZ|nr:sigma-70 family RNA polymerase sigma factor [Actinomycetota bacterium]MSW78558.1 sigma-70 family RNA polymerase sigma factor [Actinomycetota bacterium]MSX55865.1 sigma-70 family RNA polymerase sigma factor [Actinomycetota bacterium]MSZ83839.1 sigma-70 family RNA polymerase sigma factor [Actinomycetota bacterium]MTB18892.1 sigma-70 family RNA polymerase sigma factor [Actinomycetota bacterium]